MAKVTHIRPIGPDWPRRVTGTVVDVEEMCPICGGDDIGCLFGDWFLGDDDLSNDSSAAA